MLVIWIIFYNEKNQNNYSKKLRIKIEFETKERKKKISFGQKKENKLIKVI